MQRLQSKFYSETGIVFSYFLVSLLILFPLLPCFFSQLPFAGNGDIRLSLTILFSNLKKIVAGDFANIFQLPIVFPLSNTLTAGVNLFGQTLLVLPLYLVHLRNVYFIYNVLTFVSYIAAGYCAYLFVREWIPERWIAWIAGAMYILLPFRVHNIPQLNLMFSFPIPLALLFFSRFLKNRRTKDLVFFFISFLCQFLFDLSLGIFLGIGTGIFFLVWQLLFGFQPWRSWLRLAAAGVLFILCMVLIFHPYLSSETSFSSIDELTSISPSSFSTPLSFYSNWTYLLLFFKRIFWNQSPYSPGISLFVFFLLAFGPYLENRLQKTVALACSLFMIVPAIAVPIIYNGLSLEFMNRLCGWALLSFLLSLSLLLVLIRKKVPRPLLLLAVTWMLLQFYSNQVSLPFLNLFQGLARVFPFLLRSRGIHTEYLLMLLFFSVSAFGFANFFRRFRGKKIVLALVLLLVFAERLRWPVHPEKLEDDRPNYRAFYQTLAPYPDHYGLLELPFYPQSSNHYPLYTPYHDKHTYHGHIFYLSDYFELNTAPQLQAGNGFPGLGEPPFIRMLKEKGIRLIMIFKSKVFQDRNEGEKNWHKLQDNVREGMNRELYEKVEKTASGILLVINEHEYGPQIRYFLPNYSLRGKQRVVCLVDAHQEKEAKVLFNDRPLEKRLLRPGSRNEIVVDLAGIRLAAQFNYLEIRSGPSLELIKTRIE